MKAVVLNGITPADQVKLTEVPIPQVKPGWVLVKVRAFGMNHSEQVLRLSEIEAPYIQKPVIPGIECVGEIAEPSDSGWKVGQKVVALMGGMGRSFNGSYAEYALLPVHHVFPVDTDLPWDALAAVPETWFTAWGSLFECLQLKSEDTLLIRGATCALGYARSQGRWAVASSPPPTGKPSSPCCPKRTKPCWTTAGSPAESTASPRPLISSARAS